MSSDFHRIWNEIQRQQNRIRSLLDPPALRMLREAQLRHQELVHRLTGPTQLFHTQQTRHQAIDSLTSINRLLPRHFPGLDEAMSRVLRGQIDLLRLHGSFPGNVASAYGDAYGASIRRLAEFDNLSARALGLAFALPASLNLFGALAASSGSFGAQLRERLDELDVVADEDDDESVISALESLVVLFVSKCASLVSDLTSFSGMVGLLGVVLTIYALIDSRHMEARLGEQSRAKRAPHR